MIRFTVLILLNAIIITAYSCKNTDENSKENTQEIVSNKIVGFDNPSKEIASLPRLFASDENLYMSWVEREDSLAILKYSIFNTKNWSDPVEVTSGNDWFVNWADFPAIAANNGNILTNILQKSADGTYTYDVKLNLNSLAGDDNLIPKNFILHNDGTQSEHGFVSMIPWGDDSFFITWLDGRNTPGENAESNGHGHGGGAMTLRAARVTYSGEILDRTELDDRVCDCCKTSAAMTPSGPVVVYRDRDEDEIRDISMVRWEQDQGWSKPKTLGNDQWEIQGCPVNGPAIDALDSTLVTAWFTAPLGDGKVNVNFSTDGGLSFSDTYRVDAGNATGRVDVVMLNQNEAALIWMEPHGKDEFIQLMKIDRHGVKQSAITVAKTSVDRASGFPQLELLKDKLYISWTYIGENTEIIKTASISVEDL